MKTNEMTKKEYTDAWEYHINQFARLWLSDNNDMDRLISIQDELRNIIEKEANHLESTGNLLANNAPIKLVFNSGRQYTKEGQIIAAIYNVDDSRIYFSDISRGIARVIDLGEFGIDDLSESSYPSKKITLKSMVMAYYDSGNYRGPRYVHSQEKGNSERDILKECESLAVTFRDEIRKGL